MENVHTKTVRHDCHRYGHGVHDSTLVLAQDMSNGADNFYKSKKVTVQKVTFKNQYK